MSEASDQAAEAQIEALALGQEWCARRTFDGAAYTAESLAEFKGSQRVSVIVPLKEAAKTVGRVVASCGRLQEAGVVDEVIVVDAASTDGGAEAAAREGAEVLQENDLLPEFGPVLGKGDALWRALSVATGDVVVFVDSDTEGFTDRFITGLAGPLLADETLRLVKGAFDRPFTSSGVRIEGGGGRVNELVARPLLNAFFPELAAVRQPLAGELAARRDALINLPFSAGYGVEIQLLIDFYLRHGLNAIGQSDLGERLNRHQSLQELAPMAFTVLRALMSRVPEIPAAYSQSDRFLGYFDGEPAERNAPSLERPPLATLTRAAV